MHWINKCIELINVGLSAIRLITFIQYIQKKQKWNVKKCVKSQNTLVCILLLFYKLAEMVGEASLSSHSLRSHSGIDQRRGGGRNTTINDEGL